MLEILSRLLADGYPAAEQLVTDATEETLHLEFKRFGGLSGAGLAKDDRKMIAKALCGLANAEGGLLILGVETAKPDGVDVASALRPIADIQRAARVITGAVGEMLNPQHTGVRVHAVEDTGAGAGIVVLEVPPSDNRPHMCVVSGEYSYYRRGSAGTIPMAHGEVRDLILAPQQGRLEFRWQCVGTGGTEMDFGAAIQLILRNSGRMAVRAPYITCKRPILNQNRDIPSHRRTDPDGSMTVACDASFVLHPGQELAIASIGTWLNLHSAVLGRAEFVKVIRRQEMDEGFSVGSSRRGQEPTPPDELPNTELTFGAENAPSQTVAFAPDRWTLFERIVAAVEPDLALPS